MDSIRIESLMLMRIQRLMGKMPTTRAMAGIVSGSKERNSTIRLSDGSLRRTQTIVGMSSTSIAIDVIAASSSEAVMASMRSGVLRMLVHASMVRGAVTLLPRVENSNIAAMGTRKKAPMTRNTITRKTRSLLRRERLIAATATFVFEGVH